MRPENKGQELVQRRTGFRSPIFGLERLRRGNNAYPAYRSRRQRPILGIAVVAFLLLDLVMVYTLTRDDDTIPRGLNPLGLTDRSGQGGSSLPAGVEGRDGTEVAALTLSEAGQESTSKSTDHEHSRPAAHASGGGSDSGSGSSTTASSTSTSSGTGTSSSGGSIGGGTGSGVSGSDGSGSSGSGSGGSGSGGSDSGGSGSSVGPGGSGGGGGTGDGGGSGDGGAGGAGGGG
jgi:hypothetical protein